MDVVLEMDVGWVLGGCWWGAGVWFVRKCTEMYGNVRKCTEMYVRLIEKVQMRMTEREKKKKDSINIHLPPSSSSLPLQR